MANIFNNYWYNKRFHKKKLTDVNKLYWFYKGLFPVLLKQRTLLYKKSVL